MIRRLLPLALTLSLSACGFHLRNALVLPDDLGPVRVASADPYSPLAQSLTLSLERSGAAIAGTEVRDSAVLDVLSERWGDTPVSIDAIGRTQELSLRYAVSFEMRDASGDVLVPQQTIELARDYVSNPTNSIGTEGEREILMRELRREMVSSVMRRIDSVSRSDAVIAIPVLPNTAVVPTDPQTARDIVNPVTQPPPPQDER